MIPRYARAEMGRLWSEETKFRIWWEIETLVVEALADRGAAPRTLVKAMRAQRRIDPEEIAAAEAETHHDVIAFLDVMTRGLGEDAHRVHAGLTSSDLVDTAQAVRLRRAGLLVDGSLGRLETAIARQASRHKHTIMVGRTHGVHAEPITFGLKLAVWLDEVRRDRARLARAVETVSCGKLSGSVGTFAHLAPDVEAYVCGRLDLRPAPASTQVIQRDRIAEMLTTLAIIGGSLEKFAVEIRGLERTEVGEVAEPFLPGQKGSSSMPHKRNPILCERISGLARVLRGYAVAALEDIALWHERDISHSSVERVILPDAFTLVDYMCDRMTGIVEGMSVDADRMRENLDRTRGLIFSQRVLLALIEKGWSRREAYDLVQTLCEATRGGGPDFRERLKGHEKVLRSVGPEEVDAWFDPGYYVRHVDEIFERVGV